MSWRLRMLNVSLRCFAKPTLSIRSVDAVASRRRFGLVSKGFLAPPFLLHLTGDLQSVTVRLRTDDYAILYFHGGAYVTGSPLTHRALAGRIACLTGLPVFLPDYRLAPENSAPAAFDDAVAAHTGLIAKGYTFDRVILAGDSAGGGLALALLAHLCACRTPPLGLFAFSPWTDLALTGQTLATHAKTEALIPVEAMARIAALVRGQLAATDPRISPLYARYPGAPPVLLQVGSRELLLDDSRRMAEVLRHDGGQVTLQEWNDCPHVWQIFDGYVPEARQALRAVAAFVAGLLPPVNSGSTGSSGS